MLAKHEEFIFKDPAAFFPPIAIAKHKKPYDNLVDEYNRKQIMYRKQLEEFNKEQDDNSIDNENNSAQNSDRQDDEQNNDIIIQQVKSTTPKSDQSSPRKIEVESPIRRLNKETQTNDSDLNDDSSAKKHKSDSNKDDKTVKPVESGIGQSKRGKSKSRTNELHHANAISPIMENRDEEEEIEYCNKKQLNSSISIPPIKFNQENNKLVTRKSIDQEEKEKAPYFISGGFIPNSVLVRILWPPTLMKEMSEKEQSFWKPKGLSEEQMEQLKTIKKTPVRRFFFIFMSLRSYQDNLCLLENTKNCF